MYFYNQALWFSFQLYVARTTMRGGDTDASVSHHVLIDL